MSAQAHAIQAASLAISLLRASNTYSCKALALCLSGIEEREADEVLYAYKKHSGADPYSCGFESIPRVVWMFLPGFITRRIRIRKLDAFRDALIKGEVTL